jgi:hypothetical protein
MNIKNENLNTIVTKSTTSLSDAISIAVQVATKESKNRINELQNENWDLTGKVLYLEAVFDLYASAFIENVECFNKLNAQLLSLHLQYRNLSFSLSD